MTFLLLTTLLLGLVVCFASKEEIAQEKLDSLLERVSSTDLISVSGTDFDKFISRGPRPYYALVILTALKSGNCDPCTRLHPEIEKLAGIINQNRGKKKDDEYSLFVLNVDFNDNRQTFQQLGLSTAPQLVLVPPTKTSKAIPLNKFFKSINQKYQYPLTKGQTAEDIGGWISSVSGVSINFGGVSSFESLDQTMIGGIFVALIFVVAALYYFRALIDKVRRWMPLYAAACMVAYSFIIGGGMFPYIRHTPWMHVDKGQVGYIHHQSRYQYGIETYYVGAANFGAAMGVWMYINAQRVGIGNHFLLSNKYLRSIFSWVPAIIPVAAMWIGYYFIMKAYNFKNSHNNWGHVGMTG